MSPSHQRAGASELRAGSNKSKALPASPKGSSFKSSKFRGPRRAGPLWPGRGLFIAVLFWLACAVAAVAWPVFYVLFLGYGLALAVTTLVVAIDLHRSPEPQITRIIPESFPLGEWTEIKLRLEAPEDCTLQMEIFDHYPTTPLKQSSRDCPSS